VQLYLKAGKGFHSNDTRVVVANDGKEILPAAYGSDLGIILHPAKKLLFNAAAWYLYLRQEFVYVGDAGIIEPSGKTRRIGADFSARYQFTAKLFADANINWAKGRFIENPKGEDYIPLAPTVTSTGGISYQNKIGLTGSLRYRYIKSRPANETNTVKAKGYFVTDATINYTKSKFEVGLAIENLFNTKWNETQFNIESRLKNEPAPVSELHFTPGVPFFAKIKAALFF
ncbi:MAG: TonB-dependent receptor domain-containing protein, partial [Chitinophagaceae bacterium]